jgi:hypothetical protein
MAGAQIDVNFDLDQAECGLRRLAALGEDATPLMEIIGTGMAKLTRKRLGGTEDSFFQIKT